MKKRIYIGLIVITLFFVSACSDGAKNDIENTAKDKDNEVVELDEDNDSADNEGDEDSELQYGYETMQEEFEDLDFDGFKMVANLPENNEVYIEIKKDSNGIVEAYWRDESVDWNLKGYSAFNQIRTTVDEVITKDSSEEEVIDTVTSGFGLSEDYEDVEVDVIFNDGTEKNYKSEK